MRVVSTGRPSNIAARGRMGVVNGGRLEYSQASSGRGYRYDNATLAAQVVNAYPNVSSRMKLHAERIAKRARDSYWTMADTGDTARGVRVVRGRAIDGAHRGAPLDYYVQSTGRAAAKLEFGFLTGRDGDPRETRRKVPGRWVMRNAARGAGAATPVSRARRRTSARNRRRRTSGNWR